MLKAGQRLQTSKQMVHKFAQMQVQVQALQANWPAHPALHWYQILHWLTSCLSMLPPAQGRRAWHMQLLVVPVQG
jgi:hypothetical protein